MSILLLPLELRCHVYDWLLPERQIDYDVRRRLYRTGMLRINRQIRYEALEHYSRTKVLIVPTRDPGMVDMNVDSALLHVMIKACIIIRHAVTVTKSCGGPPYRLGMDINGLHAIEAFAKRLQKIKHVDVILGHVELEPRIFGVDMWVNLAGVLVRYLPGDSTLNLQQSFAGTKLLELEEEAAVQNCRNSVREGLMGKLAMQMSTLSLYTEFDDARSSKPGHEAQSTGFFEVALASRMPFSWDDTEDNGHKSIRGPEAEVSETACRTAAKHG